MASTRLQIARWEEELYQILRQLNPNVPVYVVKREDGTGRLPTLHRNLLLPIGHIDPDETIPAKEKPIPKPRRKKTQLNQEEHQEELTNMSYWIVLITIVTAIYGRLLTKSRT
jgi:hypothetical protein